MRVKISRFQSRLLFAVLTLSLFTFGASAAPLCTSTTLNNLIGTSCEIGNYVFSFPGSGAFTYTDGNTSGNPYSSVLVTPTGDGTTIGGQTGFIFTPVSPTTWTAGPTNGQFADLNFAFSANITTPGGVLATQHVYVMNSATLAINPTITSPDGSQDMIVAGENIAGTNGGGISLNIFGNSDLQSQGFGGTALSGSTSLYGTSYSVSKDILDAALNTGTVSTNSVTETFSFISVSVPEPGAFLLVAGGMGLVFFLRRRAASGRVLGLAVLAMVVAAGSAHASPLCSSLNGGSVHVSDLITAGQCSIGDILFTFSGVSPSSGSYQYSGNASLAPLASNVSVGIVDNAANGKIGFNFVPVFLVSGFTGAQSETVTFSFTAQASTSTILGFFGSYVGSTFGSGAYTAASAEVTNGGDITTVPPGNDPLNLGLSGNGSSTVTFATPVDALTTLTFTETLTFTAPTGSNNAHLSGVEMDLLEPVASVPEPMSLALVGGALVGLGILARKRRSKNA